MAVGGDFCCREGTDLESEKVDFYDEMKNGESVNLGGFVLHTAKILLVVLFHYLKESRFHICTVPGPMQLLLSVGVFDLSACHYNPIIVSPFSCLFFSFLFNFWHSWLISTSSTWKQQYNRRHWWRFFIDVFGIEHSTLSSYLLLLICGQWKQLFF